MNSVSSFLGFGCPNLQKKLSDLIFLLFFWLLGFGAQTMLRHLTKEIGCPHFFSPYLGSGSSNDVKTLLAKNLL